MPWTRLVLYEVYVRTQMTFAASIWTVQYLLAEAPAPPNNPLGTLTAQYRRGLRTLLGVHYSVRSTILHILSLKWPLEVILLKAVWRYFKRTKGL